MTFDFHIIYDYLLSLGFSISYAKRLNLTGLLIIVILLIIIIDLIAKRVVIVAFNQFATKSKTTFDDFLVKNNVPRNIAHIIPLLITIKFAPVIFVDFLHYEPIFEKWLHVFAIILSLWIARSFFNTVKDYLKTLPNLKDKPIESYIQVVMIFAWVIGILYAFAVLTETSVWKFFTALGAASAVIILVFKDTIMGFIASIQISINDMVRIGDWITFEKYGADGDVTEITLATVKVQNFDKTITTIPTYALISDSFKNWRGMVVSDGRRIKRAIIIKQSSIKYLSNDEVEQLSQIQLITNYIHHRQNEITSFNSNNNINKNIAINGRNLTNIGVFRKYIDTYLNNHSAINKEMMIMVRQLAPTSQGIPLEIYAFSADKRWGNYEYIMADIFDHVLAAVPYFKLELFELPSDRI